MIIYFYFILKIIYKENTKNQHQTKKTRLFILGNNVEEN